MTISLRQREVLRILVEHDCECWGQAWTHCDWQRWGAVPHAAFSRVCTALVGKGLVREGEDRLEVTERGLAAHRAHPLSRPEAR